MEQSITANDAHTSCRLPEIDRRPATETRFALFALG